MTAAASGHPTLAPARLGKRAVAAGIIALIGASVLGVTLGPVSIAPGRALIEVLNQLPGVDIDSGLSASQAGIISEIRLPRVVLGLLVGALLSVSGAAYQGAFRNPLADPYTLGVAAGAGLGATIAIVNRWGNGAGFFDPVPLMAFAGALVAVALSYGLGSVTSRNAVSLLLAGVAVASFLTALQTYVLQRSNDVIREVYSWIFGRLSTAGWSEVALVLPYAVITVVVVMRYRRALDVLAVGDEEARALGLDPGRTRAIVVLAASLGAAAAVAVGGLIGFVGIIVPHAVRLVVGVSNRLVIPLTVLFGGAFMVLADLMARTVLSPAELPIGVLTAFLGAPFFAVVLRTTRRHAW